MWLWLYLMSVMMFFFQPGDCGIEPCGAGTWDAGPAWVRFVPQYAPIYQEAQEHLVGKVMEYIRGISVLRSFPKARRDRWKSALRSRKWDAD